jgi:hypothetical protein
MMPSTGHGPAHHDATGFTRIDAPRGEAAIAAFVAAAMAEPERHAHMDDAGKNAEHMAAMDLAARAEATHVAVAHGSWFDAATWAGGVVPGQGARVLVPKGIEVLYDGASDAGLATLRVDGHLRFMTDGAARMRVDTLVTGTTGHLTIGTADDPVTGSVEVLFTGGAIDVAWDPMLLSRGLIAHGTTTIHGEKTEAHAKVAADPMAGDRSITLTDLPEGWSVGDRIVIAGTNFEGHKWGQREDGSWGNVWHAREDEVREIAGIETTGDGVVIRFDAPLLYDHDTPRDDLKASVANMSRSVTFATEAGPDAAVHERGHVMFMHSDAVDVRYAAFDDLGRTDKSRTSVPVESLGTVEHDSNVQGRYSMHLHRTGIEDKENPAMLVGNAVSGSPGWGYVHHDSHAVLQGNASYDTFGAGYVAETGNETGAWTANIAIGAQGLNGGPKTGPNNSRGFDLARTGDGFWFQGRMVESSDNVAASVNHGFVYMHRGSGMLDFDGTIHDFPELFPGDTSVGPDDAPILEFRGNEAFAAKQGLHVVKANPNQGHDVHSHFEDFTAWQVKSGAHFEYTSHYTIEDFDLIGREATRFNTSTTGISFGNNTTDMAVVGGHIAGFARAGIDLRKSFAGDAVGNPATAHAYHVVGTTFGDGQQKFLNLDPALDTILEVAPAAVSPRLILDGPLTYKEGWQDPAGRKVVVTGTKIDSLGTTPFPAGTDSVVFDRDEVVHILETEGWFTTPDGRNVFVVEILFSDRMTGEIAKTAYLVEIDDNVPLGNPHFIYRDAVYSGMIDPDSLAPVTGDDRAETAPDTDVIIDVTANDTDPDGPLPRLDGATQPRHGEVFAQSDGTILYRPDYGFEGIDSFTYWATDGLNYTAGTVTVDVTEPEPTPGAPVPAPEDQTPAPADPEPVPDGTEPKPDNDRPAPEAPTPEGPTTEAPPSPGSDPADPAPTPDGAVLRGTEGHDRLTGSDADELIEGLGGRDLMLGGGGDDTLNGGDGDDVLWGGPGADLLTGGGGRDVFVLMSDDSDGPDRVTDFAGPDVVGFDDRMFGPGDAGIDIRTMTRAEAFAALEAGYVRLRFDEGLGGTVLSLDPDGRSGAAAATPALILDGVEGLTLADVILF